MSNNGQKLYWLSLISWESKITWNRFQFAAVVALQETSKPALHYGPIRRHQFANILIHKVPVWCLVHNKRSRTNQKWLQSVVVINFQEASKLVFPCSPFQRNQLMHLPRWRWRSFQRVASYKEENAWWTLFKNAIPIGILLWRITHFELAEKEHYYLMNFLHSTYLQKCSMRVIS